MASRNDHITPASQLGQDQQDGPRAVIHGDRVQSRYVKRGVRGCKRIQNRAGKVSVSRPAVTRVQIQFNVDVATRKVSNCIRGIGSKRCPAEVGMQNHTGRVDHPTRPASIDRDRRRQRCLDRLAKQSHTTRVAGAALDHRRLVSDDRQRAPSEPCDDLPRERSDESSNVRLAQQCVNRRQVAARVNTRIHRCESSPPAAPWRQFEDRASQLRRRLSDRSALPCIGPAGRSGHPRPTRLGHARLKGWSCLCKPAPRLPPPW